MSPRKSLFLALAFVLGIIVPVAQAQPVDVITNNTFENPSAPLGFAAISMSDGSVARTTVNPITGSASLKVTVNSFGRVIHYYGYGFGSGPYASSVTFTAKLRVDTTTISGRQLRACAVAYFLDGPDPEEFCRNYPVDDTTVVDVRLALDTNDRQLNYIFPKFEMTDTGTIEATVDDVHYYVEEAQLPAVPSGYERVDLIVNNGFEDSEDDLAFEPESVLDGTVAHTDVNPIIGNGSMNITVNSYGRISAWLPYGYGAGPFADSVTLSAKLRVDSSTISGRELTACTIVYFFDDPERDLICDSFPVNEDDVVNVYLSLDTDGRQLQYILPQFTLDDSGTIEATVDSVHFYVVQPLP
ncbi:MAG TPA: hypothetical protein VGQ76_14880 [Thermoanaerobaculia bacterium]|jgi:hypothetical protein|nr:hypothetical protein [Thermoanaerobaculia bacterium]